MRSGFYLRPWQLKDAGFVISLRNNPELKQYFRQEKDLSLKEQIDFMKQADKINYKGYILYSENKRVGVFGLHGSELCVAAPLEYHAVGVKILKAMYPHTMFFGDVFVYNPALGIYLNECGFDAFAVVQRYCKKGGEWVSAVKICSL